MWDSSVNHSEMLLLLILRRNASPNFPLIRTMIIYITLSSEIEFPSIIIYDVYGNLRREIEQILSSTITDERTGTRNLDRSLSFMSPGSTKDQMNQIIPSLASPLSRTHIEGGEADNEWGSLSLVGCELPILAPDPVGHSVAHALLPAWVNDKLTTDTGVIVTERDWPLGCAEVSKTMGRDHNNTSTEPQVRSSNYGSATYYLGGFGQSLHVSEPQLLFYKMG